MRYIVLTLHIDSVKKVPCPENPLYEPILDSFDFYEAEISGKAFLHGQA